jgi:hypothetical protein
MKSLFKVFSTVIVAIFLTSCEQKKDFITEGYKPIYMNIDEVHRVQTLRPMNLINTGKIYLYNDYIFVNERGRGVHVINNTNPQNPLNIKFLSIPGNYDIAIRNNILFADNVKDLVAIDISNLDNPVVKSRIPNVYDEVKQMFPDFVAGYFECVDPSKGFVIGWTKTKLTNPKCRR